METNPPAYDPQLLEALATVFADLALDRLLAAAEQAAAADESLDESKAS